MCCPERAGEAPARVPWQRAAGLPRVPHHSDGLAARRPAVQHQDTTQGNYNNNDIIIRST